jgi:hypothetical protein
VGADEGDCVNWGHHVLLAIELANVFDLMVGATGIEPVTPTMSTYPDGFSGLVIASIF